MSKYKQYKNLRSSVKSALYLYYVTFGYASPIKKKEYLQYYLNEFCYKFNRRYFYEKLFDRLATVAACYSTYFKSKIYNRNTCR